MKNEDLKQINDELNESPIGNKKRRLIALEDESGMIHLTTEKGVEIYIMDKETYLQLLKHKNK